MSLFEKRMTILADPEALSIAVANWLFHLATGKKGIFTICLSGGNPSPALRASAGAPVSR
jgi:hypothetical protein